MKGEQESVIMLESMRTIRARGNYVLSVADMRRYGIRAVYNSAGSVDVVTWGYMGSMVSRVSRGLEACLVETSLMHREGFVDPIRVVSVLVFYNEWMANLYQMRHPEIFAGVNNLALVN